MTFNRSRRILVFWGLLTGLPNLLTAGTSDRLLQTSVDLPAPLEEVWHVWTTREGLQSFFAPEARIDLRVDGVLEVLFYPTNPVGQRGAEGLRILVVEPYQRFGFTWNAPTSQPVTRAQRTQVFVELETPAGSAGKLTRVTLTHQGFGQGPEWDETFRYFDAGWRSSILPRLLYRFQHGAVDWDHLSSLDPVGGASMRRRVRLLDDDTEPEPGPRR